MSTRSRSFALLKGVKGGGERGCGDRQVSRCKLGNCKLQIQRDAITSRSAPLTQLSIHRRRLYSSTDLADEERGIWKIIGGRRLVEANGLGEVYTIEFILTLLFYVRSLNVIYTDTL